jgi:hypothetical protein
MKGGFMDFIFSDAPKELIFKNPEKGQEIVLLYNEPSAETRIQYGGDIATIYRDKEIKDVRIEDIVKVQLEYGLKCLSGFRVIGVPINISCDPQSPEYREDWKEMIKDRAPELIIKLCQNVFDTGGFVPEKN